MTKRKAAKKAKTTSIPVSVPEKQGTNAMTTQANASQAQSIIKLVKSTENSLKSVLSNVTDSVAAKANKALDVRNTHAYKTKHAYKKSSVARLSRRAYVIKLIHEAKYTKAQINALLISTYDIADKSNNLKAISGTAYDVTQNSTCNVKTDSDTEIMSCISTDCKHKA